MLSRAEGAPCEPVPPAAPNTHPEGLLPGPFQPQQCAAPEAPCAAKDGAGGTVDWPHPAWPVPNPVCPGDVD